MRGMNKFGSNLLFLQVTMFVMADKHENTFKQSLSRDVGEETSFYFLAKCNHQSCDPYSADRGCNHSYPYFTIMFITLTFV